MQLKKLNKNPKKVNTSLELIKKKEKTILKINS